MLWRKNDEINDKQYIQSILKSIQQKVSLLEASGITSLAVMNPNPNYTHIILSLWSKTPFDVMRIDSYILSLKEIASIV